MKPAIRIRPVFQRQEFTVVVLEESDGHEYVQDRGGYAFRSIAPVAVIIQSGSETFALDMSGNPVSSRQLDDIAGKLGTLVSNSTKPADGDT